MDWFERVHRMTVVVGSLTKNRVDLDALVQSHVHPVRKKRTVVLMVLYQIFHNQCCTRTCGALSAGLLLWTIDGTSVLHKQH